jgi:hypothetical protein
MNKKCQYIYYSMRYFDRNLVWIKQSTASFVECLKFLKAIKVVENVLKALLKAMTYYQMTNYHASDTC